MGSPYLITICKHTFRNGKARGCEHLFAAFVHGKGRGQDTRMRVGNAPIPNTLNTATFAPAPMQRIKQHQGQFASDQRPALARRPTLSHCILLTQSRSAFTPTDGHFALGRRATHQTTIWDLSCSHTRIRSCHWHGLIIGVATWVALFWDGSPTRMISY